MPRKLFINSRKKTFSIKCPKAKPLVSEIEKLQGTARRALA